MAMLGYGTALKILSVKEGVASLDRTEIVIFVNSIAMLSENMTKVGELTHLYWQNHRQQDALAELSTPVLFDLSSTDIAVSPRDATHWIDLVDKAVGIAASLAPGGHISPEREKELVHLTLQRISELMVLVKHYSHDLNIFWST